MKCAMCQRDMVYVHGHAACANGSCPFYGRNQAECCDGETASNCALSTADIARMGPAPKAPPQS
jgi:hypothetical protein